MNKKILVLAILGGSFFFFAALSARGQAIEELIGRLEESFQARDVDAYLDAFAPEWREREKKAISRYFDELKMETIRFHWANRGSYSPKSPDLFLQVLSENAYSALVEIWQLKVAAEGEGYRITDKEVRTNLSQLYKLKMPSERIERVDAVEIRHVDISLNFKDALLFYDNIPDLETALLIIGPGRLFFSPSDEKEKHQLHLMFGSRVLEDRVDYVFLRFSPSFFENNITIHRGDETKEAGKKKPVSEAERNKAYSLFMKYASHYFTIESPMTEEPLSFVPRGEEAIFEFRAKKTGELVYIYSPFAEEEVTLYDRSQDRFLNLYSPSPEGEKKRLIITFGEKYDVEHCDIELSFEPKNSYLSARARLSLSARIASLDAVKFRFNPSLEILRVYDQARRELFFTQDKDSRNLYVYFLEPVERNVLTSIEVYYRGVLEPPPQHADTLASLQRSDSYLLIPPQFDTYLYSQSAYWYPSPPEEDYFTARMKIIVPPEYSAVANGHQVEAGRLNGLQRVTEMEKVGSAYVVFQTETPVKYLTFLVGKLTLVETGEGSLPLFSYVASDVRSQKRNLLEEARRIVEYYENRFGPFPFEVLRVVQRLWVTGGGHSPASFVILNDLPRSSNGEKSLNLAFSGKGPVDLTQWKEYFIAHEIAHQWWGQAVTWARYRDQWLSEGMAQFATALYLRSKYGEEAFSRILKRFASWTEKKSRFGPITLGSRLSYLDFEAYQAIIYNKSALVLNMLHDLLGDEVFFKGMREFQSQRRFSAAVTNHFRQAMEKASGRDLEAFFSLWFDSHLLPEVKARYSLVQGGEGPRLRILVEQGSPAFMFPLWVEWQEGKDKKWQRRMLVIDRKIQEFEFPLEDQLRRIRLNPDHAVPGQFFLSRG